MSVLVASVASGCSSGSGLFSKAPPPAYDLVAARCFHHRVGHPRGRDNDKVVVRPQPGKTAALNDAQWEDRLPKLIQARLIQSFENANRLRRPEDKLATDLVLVSNVRRFEISVPDQSAVVEMPPRLCASAPVAS